MQERARLRMGEFSKRVGASPELLRAWEVRYGLLRPQRTSGGLRLFSEQDELRVRLMHRHLADGVPAGEAARLALLGTPAGADPAPGEDAELVRALGAGVEALDGPAVEAALDRAFELRPLPAALSGVILPFMRGVGERWAAGGLSVGQEHFASNLVGARLRALARGWDDGVGPRALLACQPGERHDIGLVCFGLVLRDRGWRVTYLGADTPLHEVTSVCRELELAIVVLSAVDARRFKDTRRELATLAGHARVAIGGAGAGAALSRRLGVELLGGDAVAEAVALTPAPATGNGRPR